MAGGLLNIISVGNANVILNGNPTKTFFKVVYSKYTNFGLQKFRLDYEGSRDLRTTTSSQFTFKIKRYADLLLDTYLVVTLPDIWSPIYNPSQETNYQWVGYDFRWIKNIGIQMIESMTVCECFGFEWHLKMAFIQVWCSNVTQNQNHSFLTSVQMYRQSPIFLIMY